MEHESKKKKIKRREKKNCKPFTQNVHFSVMVHCSQRGAEAIVGDLSHIFLYEQGINFNFILKLFYFFPEVLKLYTQKGNKFIIFFGFSLFNFFLCSSIRFVFRFLCSHSRSSIKYDPKRTGWNFLLKPI